MHILKLHLRRNSTPIYVIVTDIVAVSPSSGVNNMNANTEVVLRTGGSIEVKETCFSIQCKLQECGFTFMEIT